MSINCLIQAYSYSLKTSKFVKNMTKQDSKDVKVNMKRWYILSGRPFTLCTSPRKFTGASQQINELESQKIGACRQVEEGVQVNDGS